MNCPPVITNPPAAPWRRDDAIQSPDHSDSHLLGTPVLALGILRAGLFARDAALSGSAASSRAIHVSAFAPCGSAGSLDSYRICRPRRFGWGRTSDGSS